jgi:hypothetical protein
MSDNEIDEAHLSEDEIEVENTEQKAIKPSQSGRELFDEYLSMRTNLEEVDSKFNDKIKQFDKDEKEYLTERKKLQKELDILLKKFDKIYTKESSKATKKRKTGNSGKGGFNKLVLVPKKLRAFLELADDTLMARPAVTHLLNDKFKLLKFRSPENGKVIKISDKKSAKILGCEYNHEIQFNEFQGFIAKFYNDEKTATISA